MTRTREKTQEVLHLVEINSGDREPESSPALMINLSNHNAHVDVIDALALQPFANGAHGWSRAGVLEHVRAEAPLHPEDARLLRVSHGTERMSVLAEGDGWMLLAKRWKGGGAYVAVSAVTEELAEQVYEEATKDATDPPEPAEDEVAIGFWYRATHGGERRERAITAGSWAELRTNYPAPAAGALDQVMALRPERIGGRLLLLHGPPGTGKTTALRALARSWLDWCQADCVLDPEALFGDPGYLMQVAVGTEEDDEEKRRWRLLILEDCDELIRGEAKQSTGQGLSRLLNLTDGMLGQGRDVLVAITTNEDLIRLHPAVIRPGRCLAQIEVGRLSHAEAVAWLGPEADHSAVGPDGASLAELVALRRGEQASGEVPGDRQTGFYL